MTRDTSSVEHVREPRRRARGKHLRRHRRDHRRRQGHAWKRTSMTPTMDACLIAAASERSIRDGSLRHPGRLGARDGSRRSGGPSAGDPRRREGRRREAVRDSPRRASIKSAAAAAQPADDDDDGEEDRRENPDFARSAAARSRPPGPQSRPPPAVASSRWDAGRCRRGVWPSDRVAPPDVDRQVDANTMGKSTKSIAFTTGHYLHIELSRSWCTTE